jgi:type IV secretory pathway TrbF-like protein
MTKDLNYCKAILYKVSFDPSLFKKELLKAYRLLSTQEQLELEDWVKTFVQNKQPLRSVLFSNSDAISLG